MTFYWPMANPLVGVTTRPRLLLVDDNQDNLEGFSVILGEKYEVFGYSSPTEALTAVPAIRPDVLVLDIGMRPITGVQCLKTIRAMAGFADVPAVALTGFARDADREAFLAAGFQAVVVKPVLEPEDLGAVIDTLLESPARVDDRTPTHLPGGRTLRSLRAATPRLDGQPTTTASSARGSGKADGRARFEDENSG